MTPVPTSGAAPRWVAFASWATLLLPLVLVGAVLHDPNRIHHDNALYLQCGELIAAGQRPYIDFVELNPPLIMYLNAVPALAARQLGIHSIIAFSLCVILLVVYSSVATQIQLRRDYGLALLVGVVWQLFHLLLWIAGPFGQREHLFVLLYLPFLVCRWRRYCGEVPVAARASLLASLAGVLAALGVCLKPYFALPVIGAEACGLALSRRRSAVLQPEVAAFVITAAAYGLYLLQLPAAFATRWLPMIGEGYSVYAAPWTAVLNRTAALCSLSAVVVLASSVALQSLRGRAHSLLAAMLASFSLGAVAAYVMQHKGWPYQQIPALAGATLCLATLSYAVKSRVTARCSWAAPPAIALVPTLFLVGTATQTWRLGNFDSELWSRPLAPVIQTYTRENEAVLFLSTSVVPAYPTLVQTGRRPGSRYLWLFPLPMLVRHRLAAGTGGPAAYDPNQVAAEEKLFLRELETDLSERRPPLIFINEALCQGCPLGFSLARYLDAMGVLRVVHEDYQRVSPTAGLITFVRQDRIADKH